MSRTNKLFFSPVDPCFILYHKLIKTPEIKKKKTHKVTIEKTAALNFTFETSHYLK